MSDNTSGKFTMRITINILLCVALAIYLLIFNFLLGKFMPQDTVIHWLPIAISAVAFYFAGYLAGMCDFKTTHWQNKSMNSKRYIYICSPIGKTESEISDFISKQFKKDDFNTSDLTILVAFFVFDLIILGAFAFFASSYTFNALIAFPVWIIVALIARIPTAYSYLYDVMGADWKKYVCPHCKAIYGKFDYKTTNHSEKEWISSHDVNVTDKYTDGINTVWVDRTETRYNINHNSSFDKIYTCPRCKKQIKENFSYTQTNSI
jgi:hypothetical protein